jgi:Raf kinase inhibitor-like YbhB/YbcL family protein
MSQFNFQAEAFADGEFIPVQLTCDGSNVSPHLKWEGVPAGTKSLALIMEDPDSPMGVFVHWTLYNIDPKLSELPEAIEKIVQVQGIGTQGLNDFDAVGYDGPCPSCGSSHHYTFDLYALDLAPQIPPALPGADLKKAIRGHIVASTHYTGEYSRCE